MSSEENWNNMEVESCDEPEDKKSPLGLFLSSGSS